MHTSTDFDNDVATMVCLNNEMYVHTICVIFFQMR